MSASGSAPVRLAIIGAGKMGRAVAQLAAERGCEVVATLGRGDAVTADALAGADVAVEFTEPAAAVPNARACLAAGCPVVVGTTGWLDALPELALGVPADDGRITAVLDLARAPRAAAVLDALIGVSASP